MAVPVDPEDADGALIDRKLGQAQGLLTGTALGEVFAGGQQGLLQGSLLPPLPDHDCQASQHQHHQQQAEVLPEAR
ncbi:hypothetical protein D3C80_1046380 [compost metagenome]